MNCFWQSLATALAKEPIALATVVKSQGSTPRQVGARMLITPSGKWLGTIGGGAAEGKVMVAAMEVLKTRQAQVLAIDLWGNPEQLRDGVCGGTMTLWVQYLDSQNPNLCLTVNQIHRQLSQGKRVAVVCQSRADSPLSLTNALAPPSPDCFLEQLNPPPALLIVGAGHVGRALGHLASSLGWQIMVYDDRQAWLTLESFPENTQRFNCLGEALKTFYPWQGPSWAALVTRGLPQDLDTLAELSPGFEKLDYLGILGSSKRIATLRKTYSQRNKIPLPENILHAPIGLEIGAETPEEIAVSIVGELIAHWKNSDCND